MIQLALSPQRDAKVDLNFVNYERLKIRDWICRLATLYLSSLDVVGTRHFFFNQTQVS